MTNREEMQIFAIKCVLEELEWFLEENAMYVNYREKGEQYVNKKLDACISDLEKILNGDFDYEFPRT